MDIVSAGSLDLVRAYCTDLDLRQVVRGGEAGSRELTRRLKLLCMLKGHVVVAASHLVESMPSFPFLRDHPSLLSRGIVVPALRKEFATLEDFVVHEDPKRTTSWVGIPTVLEAAKHVDSVAQLAVHWDVDDAAAFFTRLVIEHLLHRQSLLRSLMPDVSDDLAHQIVAHLQQSPRLSRDDIANSLNLIPSTASREQFRRYADLAYYIAGARAVESVGILPQENLGKFDYGSSDARRRLSEWDIFFNHCVNAIFAASGPRIHPDDLDRLEVDDILAFRDGWIGPRFRKKYERVLTLCRERIEVRDPQNTVLRLEELDALSNELTLEYGKAAKQEARIKKITNTGMSILSLVLSGVLDSADLAISGLQVVGDWIDTDQGGNGRLARVRDHVQAARQLTGDLLATNQPLTRFLDSLSERIRTRTA